MEGACTDSTEATLDSIVTRDKTFNVWTDVLFLSKWCNIWQLSFWL